jgi:hypothetical protein
MADEKSIPEKLTAALSKAADSVKSAVSHVIDTASDAAQHAMEANAERISRIPPARPDPEQVPATVPGKRRVGKTKKNTVKKTAKKSKRR